MGLRGKRDAQGEEDSADHRDRMAAVAAAEPAGEHHGDHRTRGDAQQGESQGGGGGAGLLLDGRDTDHPAGEEKTVEGEEHGQRGTEAGRRGWGGVSAKSPR
ncbi:hypothetical protein ACVWXU_007957 [Streptomyces sp. TE33382]